jgi:hypothetical protein
MVSISRRHLLVVGGASAALVTAGSGPATAGVRRPAEPGPSSVIEWNQTLLRIVRTAGAQPATVHSTRSFAIMHAAMHDAVVSTTGDGGAYLFRVNPEPGADPQAAAVQAAHDVLVALYPGFAADLDRQLAADLAESTNPAARAAGRRIGALSATLMLAVRAGDGSATPPPALPAGTGPGRYRPTPPGFGPAVFTHWPAVAPFVLDRADRFRPPPYPALDSRTYAQALIEVGRVGRDTSPTRTADQSVQARFWAAPIWNYWNEIAQSSVAAHRTGLRRAARLFAELNLTFADAVIAFYDAKYHHLIWRPVTAIRLADTDGNPATTADPTWNPLASTPNDPAYPGAHSVVSQAGAAVLSRYFGAADRISVGSEALPGTVRQFRTYQSVADEAGLSRIPAGVHTRLDHEAGRRLGQDVAGFVQVRLTGAP